MRIIAGKYSSRRLETLKGRSTRPTLDKVKEAVFSSLGGSFADGWVLDLYAGSGACGLEALSRGMEKAVLVDSSRAACGIIRRNIELLGCGDDCRVLCMPDTRALGLLADEGACFDLVYLDPPYEKQKNLRILSYLDEHDMVRPGGRVVIESLKEETYRCEFTHFRYRKESVYGIMKITYYDCI